MPGAGTLETVADAAELARVAARRILSRARDAVEQRGAFHIALSGGTTPRTTYAELAHEHALDWTRWHVWFSDERCVPPEHPASNFGSAAGAWLGAGLVPADQIHRMRGEAADALAEARRYALELRRALPPPPRLDLVLLGLGADGHTASLFPGSPVLDEREELVRATRAPSPPYERLTLTLPALNAARSVLFLVSGAEKAAALWTARGEVERDASVPAQRVRPQDGELHWIVDRDASR